MRKIPKGKEGAKIEISRNKYGIGTVYRDTNTGSIEVLGYRIPLTDYMIGISGRVAVAEGRRIKKSRRGIETIAISPNFKQSVDSERFRVQGTLA